MVLIGSCSLFTFLWLLLTRYLNDVHLPLILISDNSPTISSLTSFLSPLAIYLFMLQYLSLFDNKIQILYLISIFGYMNLLSYFKFKILDLKRRNKFYFKYFFLSIFIFSPCFKNNKGILNEHYWINQKIKPVQNK